MWPLSTSRRLHQRLARHNADQDRALGQLEARARRAPGARRRALPQERLRLTAGVAVELPERAPPEGIARLAFRKLVRGVPASMELGVAAAMLPAVRHLAAATAGCRAAELPGLDECEQVALVARLLEAQVLEPAADSEDPSLVGGTP